MFLKGICIVEISIEVLLDYLIHCTIAANIGIDIYMNLGADLQLDPRHHTSGINNWCLCRFVEIRFD